MGGHFAEQPLQPIAVVPSFAHSTSIMGFEASLSRFINQILLFYIGCPAMLVGIASSLLTLVLFMRDSQTFISTRFILSSIAVADGGYLIFMLIFCLLQVTRATENDVLFALLHYGFNLFVIFRNWLLIVMTVERFLFFHKPVKFKILWSLSRVRIIVICTAVSAVICRIPDILYVAILIHHPSQCRILQFLRLLHAFVDLLGLTVLPLILMLVLSLLTTRTVADVMHMKFSDTATSAPVANVPDNSAKIVTILRNALIVFVVTSLPSIPAEILKTYVMLNEINDDSIHAISSVISGFANLFSIVNSTANFFIYIVQSKRYRGILVESLYPRPKK